MYLMKDLILVFPLVLTKADAVVKRSDVITIDGSTKRRVGPKSTFEAVV